MVSGSQRDSQQRQVAPWTIIIVKGGEISGLEGRQILGATVARAIEKLTDIHDPGRASQRFSYAVSNRFFASHVITLLPDFPHYHSQRQLGSMLEAAVAQVSDSDGAISELAEWLIETAIKEQFIAAFNRQSAKGYLLEQGGRVQSQRIGGPQHRPVFEATAIWRDTATFHVGVGKKKAVEELAAWHGGTFQLVWITLASCTNSPASIV